MANWKYLILAPIMAATAFNFQVTEAGDAQKSFESQIVGLWVTDQKICNQEAGAYGLSLTFEPESYSIDEYPPTEGRSCDVRGLALTDGVFRMSTRCQAEEFEPHDGKVEVRLTDNNRIIEVYEADSFISGKYSRC